jgi:hypothetical protein
MRRLAICTFLRTFNHDGFSAQLRAGELAHPFSLYLPRPLELGRPFRPLPSKTSEILLPVLCHIAHLPFSLDITMVTKY